MKSIYKKDYNCWQRGIANKTAYLIDCANYYRALHHALCKARQSIFILGWDIDGRIELLRGEEARVQEIPARLSDLIRWKASDNPDLKVYLNRWNYSVFFAREREPFSGLKWHFRTPSNVHYCADYNVPFGACHHQKIIIIDDQIAFCGGMDIAPGRWDCRQHHLKVKNRVDPGGFLNFFRKKPYEPYHDIQFMIMGPIVSALGELVRSRWQNGAGFEAVPISNIDNPDLWPLYINPDFENVEIAIARTLPKTRKDSTVREVLHMYLDEIAEAEKFIYIENQYLTCQKIAKALNKRLKEKPDLRVLVVSSDHPRGFMEHKAMWTGRVKFYDCVIEGVDFFRLALTYPVCKENGTENTIHIHSKIMLVDDRFLHVGSANLNNRSMGFDTECDIIVEGKDRKSQQKISSIRNNLIREHTGREEEDIAKMIDASALDELLEYQNHSRQHLKKINDDSYRNEFLASLAKKLGDPDEAHLLINLPIRQILFFFLAIIVLGLLSWLYVRPVLPDEFRAFLSQEGLKNFIESARHSVWSPLILVGVYLLAGALFFSVMALNLVTAIVFGPFYGFLYAYLGSMMSASAGYGVGRLAGWKLSKNFKSVLEKVKVYNKGGGIIGMTMVRMVPIAPFTAVNIIFGMMQASFIAYLISTFLGLLPGITAKALFGGALGELFAHPEPKVVFYLAVTLVFWFLIIWGSHWIFQRYKETKSS